MNVAGVASFSMEITWLNERDYLEVLLKESE